jgi:hypothetical protein
VLLRRPKSATTLAVALILVAGLVASFAAEGWTRPVSAASRGVPASHAASDFATAQATARAASLRLDLRASSPAPPAPHLPARPAVAKSPSVPAHPPKPPVTPPRAAVPVTTAPRRSAPTPPPHAAVPTPAPAPVVTAPPTTAAPRTTTPPSSYGCGPALSYLAGHAAPGFRFLCPGYALGHQAMTCVNVAGVCPGEKLIAISDPCPAAYMNEANNSWVLSEGRSGPIDPYGYCEN